MNREHSLFAQAMSLAVHELRTPMTVVAGYLRMLLQERSGPLTDAQRKMLEEADRSCSRIGALVAEMSELGRLEAGDSALALQRIDLAALVRELASNVLDGRDRGVELRVRDTGEPIDVMADRTRLGAAVTAMIRSAVRERGEPGVVVMACATTAGWAVVTVGDEAAIDPLIRGARETPPALDEWQGGLGLSLPIARRVIDAHGGAIWSRGTQPFGGMALRLPLPGC